MVRPITHLAHIMVPTKDLKCREHVTCVKERATTRQTAINLGLYAHKNKQESISLALLTFESYLADVSLNTWWIDIEASTCYKFVTGVRKGTSTKPERG